MLEDQKSHQSSLVLLLLLEQDAERRDLTVNALFYNLNTRAVEDCTGRGLADLKDGVLRTPLPPLETFREGDACSLHQAPSAAARLKSSSRHRAIGCIVFCHTWSHVCRKRFWFALLHTMWVFCCHSHQCHQAGMLGSKVPQRAR